MFNFVHTHLKHLNLWIEWLGNLDILIRVLSDITLNIVYKPVYVFKFVCSEPIYSSKHSSVQARLNLHRHKLLKQQFAGVRNLNLANVRGRVTPSAMIAEFLKIGFAEETAQVADMYSVAV